MKALFGAAASAACLGAYALYEPFRFRVARYALPMRATCPPLSLLHISDTHLSRGDRALLRFLERLPDELGEIPDLVVATGDFIEDDSGIDPVVEACARFEARLGRFYVLGSHDYFVSSFQSYVKYFTGRRHLIRPQSLNTDELEAGLSAKGWVSLTNRAEVLMSERGPIRLVGVDDPYLRRHRTGHIHRATGDALGVAVMHSPDLVSECALAGFDLVLAGHTHGGQVRIPGIGALVTNSSLPAALAGGPSPVGEAWLHVSPGLSNGRFAPFRFNSPPEATLLKLIPRG